MTKPTLKQAWMPLVLAAMTFATAYLGNDKWQQSQEPTVETKVETTVEASDINVAITSMPATFTQHHDHHAHRSTENIKSLIDEAIKARMEDHLTKEGRH